MLRVCEYLLTVLEILGISEAGYDSLYKGTMRNIGKFDLS